MPEIEAEAVDPVRDYCERVLSGDIVAGELVRLACQRHLDDLERSEAPDYPYTFDAEAALQAIDLFRLFAHSKGEWAGQPIELQLWQQFIVGSIFGWKLKATGLRRFRDAHIEVARKNGKSTKCAGIALILAFFDGEPGAEVYCAATKRDQAKIVWEEAERMVSQRPALRRHIQTYRSSSTLTCEENHSKLAALGADRDTTDGLNPHGVVVDELHAHKTASMLEVLESGRGSRRQPLLVIITTAGARQESVWAQRRKLAVDVVRGVLDAPSVFVFIATLDDEDDWTDPRVWIKANPNLGVSVQAEELAAECAKAVHSPSMRNAFRRLRCNQPTETVESWLDLKRWDACAAVAVAEGELAGRECYGGLDLSSKKDITAFLLCFPPPTPEEGYKLLCRFWLPVERLDDAEREDQAPYRAWAEAGFLRTTEGNVIDYAFVEGEIMELARKYSIAEIAFDPWSATQTATRLTDDGATMVEFRQGYRSMSEPSKEWEKLVLEGRLHHGGNPVLRWMASHVSVDIDPAGNIKPSKARGAHRTRTQRIDGIVAGIMALGRATLHEEPSPYGYRGVRCV